MKIVLRSVGFVINIFVDIIEILFVLDIVNLGRMEWIDGLRDIICLMIFFFLMLGIISFGGVIFFMDGISCNLFMFDLYLSILIGLFFFRSLLFFLI